MDMLIMKVALRYEQDIVLARRRARQIAEALGLDGNAQTRVGSAVSEIARNAFLYAAGGEVEFTHRRVRDAQTLVIRVSDRGPGIGNVQEILDGAFTSKTGMGLGITGTRRLMDDFSVESTPGKGTVVTMIKTLPAQLPAVTGGMLADLAEQLRRREPESPFAEIQQQNQELVNTLQQLQGKQQELEQTNRELDDTNRGVLALYAEIDEKSSRIRSESDARTLFFSGMSHELRTPINSILSLSRLLLDHVDGELTKEQERQVSFIRTAAESLTNLVNDLLDLSRIQAGKITPSITDFTVEQVFSALRGMIKPLLAGSAVALVFEETEGIPALHTDEGKLSQILRNLASNAIKFTETGEVRISARLTPAGDAVRFSVADTGIGIAAEDLEKIFEEYVQVQSKLQAKVKGTGLGLPLSRRLAAFLGGGVTVVSAPGGGSTFVAEIPLTFPEPGAAEHGKPPAPTASVARKQVLVFEDTEKGFALGADDYCVKPVQRDWLLNKLSELTTRTGTEKILLIDDEEVARYIMRSCLTDTKYTVIEAANGTEGIRLAREQRPDIIFLDLVMPGLNGFETLERLKSLPETRDIPVVVSTSKILTESEKALLQKNTVDILSKKTTSRAEALSRVRKTLVRIANEQR